MTDMYVNTLFLNEIGLLLARKEVTLMFKIK